MSSHRTGPQGSHLLVPGALTAQPSPGSVNMVLSSSRTLGGGHQTMTSGAARSDGDRPGSADVIPVLTPPLPPGWMPWARVFISLSLVGAHHGAQARPSTVNARHSPWSVLSRACVTLPPLWGELHSSHLPCAFQGHRKGPQTPPWARLEYSPSLQCGMTPKCGDTLILNPLSPGPSLGFSKWLLFNKSER